VFEILTGWIDTASQRDDSRMPTSVSLEDLELTELAICLKIGAAREREYAQKATSIAVKQIHEKVAANREKLARRLETIARRTRQSGPLEDQPKPDPTKSWL
jgi:hypothetical protein